MDGLFSAGYEGVKSFAIATTRVTDSIAQYWANQKNATDTNGNLRYPAGAMKAAYGTFFTALMLIYCHDQVADAAASEFNVTWARTHPVAVSVGDDAYQTYLTLECDHSMGMTVIGSLKNVIQFNSACSSQISTIEYGIMRNLDLNSQYGTVSMDVMGSVTRDMFYAFWNGTDLQLFTQNGYTIMKLAGRNDLILATDPETGIVRDINTLNGFCGAYCFHDQITDLSYEHGENFIQKNEYINISMVSKLVGSVVKVYTGVEAIKAGVLLLGVAPPIGTFFGASFIVVGSIEVGRGFYQYYDAAFNTPWTTNKSYGEQFNEDWQGWYSNAGPW